MRQPPDEADRVGDEIAPAVVVEAARHRVERLEEPVAHGHRRGGEGVQERRLADVRVAGQRDGRRLCAAALLAAHVPLEPQLLEPSPEERDAVACDPAVRLELRLAGASRSDAAAEPLEVLPHSPHPRQVVLELCELDLQLALGTHGMLREDVEDQLGPVHDPRLKLVLEHSLLRRRELVVDEQDLRAGVMVGLLQLLELPFADVRACIGLRAVLDETCDRLDPRRPGELLELCELVVRIDALREHGQDESALGHRARRGIGLSYRHLRVIVLDVRCGRPLTSHFRS